MPTSSPGSSHFARGCAFDGCGHPATQAFDIWSWFRDYRRQTPTHYEVCDDHADLFDGYTGRSDDSRTFLVRNRCQPTTLSADEVKAAQLEMQMRGIRRV